MNNVAETLAVNQDLANWIGIGLPIILGVVTALVLAFYAGHKKPKA